MCVDAAVRNVDIKKLLKRLTRPLGQGISLHRKPNAHGSL